MRGEEAGFNYHIALFFCCENRSGICHLHFLLSDLIEQAEFVVIELLGQVDVDLVRVHQTAGFLPKCILFLQAVFTDIHGSGRLIDTFAVLEERNHQLAQGEFSGSKAGLFPGLDGIEEGEMFILAECLLLETDDICLDLVFRLVIDTIDLLVAGIGDLFGIFGKLDLGDEVAIVILDGSQLVDAAERRIVLGSDQIGADAPGGDRRSLVFQGVDQVLVQVVGGGDDRVREAPLLRVPLSRMYWKVLIAFGTPDFRVS